MSKKEAGITSGSRNGVHHRTSSYSMQVMQRAGSKPRRCAGGQPTAVSVAQPALRAISGIRKTSETDRNTGHRMWKLHQDHIAEKGYNSLYRYELVHTPIPMTKATSRLDAEAAADKEWDKLNSLGHLNCSRKRGRKSRSPSSENPSPLRDMN